MASVRLGPKYIHLVWLRPYYHTGWM